MHTAGDPVLIGLTGNIATGKSTVARMLVDLGAEDIDADKVAHGVMRPGEPAHSAIVDAFGAEVLSADGTIDRKRLGQLVFSDPEALEHLEAIVHPTTVRAIEDRIAGSPADVIVIEAIKLFESGLAQRCDIVWVTTCRRDQQIQRLMEGRGLTRAEARQRVDAQRPQEERAALADVVIDNSGSLAETRQQVAEAWNRTVREKRASAGESLGSTSS